MSDYITSLRPCYPRPTVRPSVSRRRPRPLTRSRSRTLKRMTWETDTSWSRRRQRLRKCGARCPCRSLKIGRIHGDVARQGKPGKNYYRSFGLMPFILILISDLSSRLRHSISTQITLAIGKCDAHRNTGLTIQNMSQTFCKICTCIN